MFIGFLLGLLRDITGREPALTTVCSASLDPLAVGVGSDEENGLSCHETQLVVGLWLEVVEGVHRGAKEARARSVRGEFFGGGEVREERGLRLLGRRGGEV